MQCLTPEAKKFVDRVAVFELGQQRFHLESYAAVKRDLAGETPDSLSLFTYMRNNAERWVKDHPTFFPSGYQIPESRLAAMDEILHDVRLEAAESVIGRRLFRKLLKTANDLAETRQSLNSTGTDEGRVKLLRSVGKLEHRLEQLTNRALAKVA